MQIPEQVDLADPHSGESISGVPIKKRISRLSWSSSSSSKETCSVPHSCNSQPKKFFHDAESSTSEDGAGVIMETNVRPYNLQVSPSTVSDQKCYQRDLQTSFPHGNPTQVYQFKNVKSVLKESSMMEDVNTGSRLSLGLEVGKQKQFTRKQDCEELIDKGTVGVQPALSDVSASKCVDTDNLHQSSCEDERYRGLYLSKQVKIETWPLDILQAKGTHNHQITNDNLNSEGASVNSSARLCMDREKLDLNVPLTVWESEHDTDATSKLKKVHQGKIDKNLIQSTEETIGNNSTSRSSMVEASQCSVIPKNLGPPADDSGGYEVGLDLQLRPPSRPDWFSNLEIAPLDLSLSLKGSVSDASVVKPEPLENGSQKESEIREVNSSVKPVAEVHVKLEQSDGSSKVPGQDSLPCMMVKLEPLEEQHEKSPDMPSDNKQLTLTCHTDVPQNLNSNTLSTENICDNRSTTNGNANIKSVESSHLPLDLGPKVPDKMEEVITDDGVCQDAKGSTTKSLNMIVGSDLSNVRGYEEKVGEINKIAEVTFSLDNKPVVSDLVKQKTSDSLSEGSTDMDCSDGECCTSPKPNAGENLHAVPGNSSEPSSGSQGGIDTQQVHKQQADVTEEHLDVPYSQSCVRKKVTSSGVGEVKVGDGDSGAPVQENATEVSCDYEEKGVLRCANNIPYLKGKIIANSAVDSVGSECCDPMDIHVDVDSKGKEIISVEQKVNHYAKRSDGIVCREKKENNYKLTAGLSVSHRERHAKSFEGALDNHLAKEKGLKMHSSPKEASTRTAETNNGLVGRNQIENRYAGMSNKHPEWGERDSNVWETANRHFHDVSKRVDFKYADNKHKYRHTEKSSPPIRSFSHRIPISSRLVTSGTENERWIDKQKRDQLSALPRRPSKFDSTNHDQPIGRFESDYMNTRRNDNRHFVRDPKIQYEELNNSRKYNLHRHNEGMEVPFDLPPNGPVRIAGRLSRTVDDQRHHCRFPSWRQLQGPPLPGQIREMVPDRFIRREVHDDILVHEEKIMNLPDEIVDDSLYSHSILHYDPTDHDLVPRGRSSSPIQRRPHPLEIYRSRSPCQWSSPGRTHETSIENHNYSELPIRHGKRVMRGDMSRSPPYPCLPEDMMVRRNVSPPYAQFPFHMREMHQADDFDLPRPSRITQRNFRSSDLDPRENAEYIGPSHFNDQFVDSRDYHDKRGLAQRLQPRHFRGRYDEEEDLPYPAGDGFLRASNFSPDGEATPARANARNYDNHVKDRLGPASDRFRIKGEQGEDYRYHGRQGWRDGGYNDGRLKRRKF